VVAKFPVAQPVPATCLLAAAFGRRTTPRSGETSGPSASTTAKPVHDHFKKIDDNAVTGIMNSQAGHSLTCGFVVELRGLEPRGWHPKMVF
jgi:Domain of unknown function (DUF4334)